MNLYNLPPDFIISVKATDDAGILFSQTAKDPSAPIVKNRAWTTLNTIKTGLEKHSKFIFEKDFEAEKISDVAQAIYTRYKTRYRESYWQSFVDLFTCCFGGKSDLEKMQDLLDEILRHSEVKVRHFHSNNNQREEDPSFSESLDKSTFSTVESSEEKSERMENSDNPLLDAFKELNEDPKPVLSEKEILEDSPKLPTVIENTISLFKQPIQLSISETEQKQLIDAIRSTFKPTEHWRGEFEDYTHSILSNIIILNQAEGSELARLKLKIFIQALLPPNDNDKSYSDRFSTSYHLKYYSRIFGLISRAAHLDQIPISKCCEHLPISKDFELTPFILKTLISEYAKNQSTWDYFVMHRIDSDVQALALIEAALELPKRQQDILLSAIADCMKFTRVRNTKALFEKKGLNIADYPECTREVYNRLFTKELSTEILDDHHFQLFYPILMTKGHSEGTEDISASSKV